MFTPEQELENLHNELAWVLCDIMMRDDSPGKHNEEYDRKFEELCKKYPQASKLLESSTA